LELKTQFPIAKGHRCYPCGPASYTSFLEKLRRILGEDFSIITFNYDVALDLTFRSLRMPANYCLDPKINNGIKFLKLHGSLNWGFSQKTKKILPYQFDDLFKRYHWDSETGEMNTVNIEIMNRLDDLKEIYSEENIDSLPIIVPPTWNKAEYHGNLSNVWHEAANELSLAENIYAIGYSLPETDTFFKYLFALGTIGKSRIKRFWVYNPDENAEKRYKGLLGRKLFKKFQFSKGNFHYFRGKMGHILNAV
jgi:hypothetical protein